MSPCQASRLPGIRLLREHLLHQCLLLTASQMKWQDLELVPTATHGTHAARSTARSLQLSCVLAGCGWPHEGTAQCAHRHGCSAPALCAPSLPCSHLSSLSLVPAGCGRVPGQAHSPLHTAQPQQSPLLCSCCCCFQSSPEPCWLQTLREGNGSIISGKKHRLLLLSLPSLSWDAGSP